ncbi:hypothetical protein ACFL6I_07355 [candidate division KSB1 bacterium]
MAQEDRRSLFNSIIDLLVKGSFDVASGKIKENNVKTIELNEITDKAYRQLIKDKNFQDAIYICETFNLPVELKISAISSNYRALCERKEFEKAFDWGVKYSMSKNDLNACSVKLFEEKLINKKVREALGCIEEYNIPQDLVINQAREAFNKFLDESSWVNAYYIGNKFDMSRKRTMSSGIRGYVQLLSADKMSGFLEMEKNFKILTDRDIAELEEADIESFLQVFNENIVKRLLEQNKPDKLFDVLAALNVYANADSNPLMSKLVKNVSQATARTHNRYISEGRGPAAVEILKNFRLIDKGSPENQRIGIIKIVEEAHHKLLRDYNLNAALFLKENYELFGRNALENSHEGLVQATTAFLEMALSKGDRKSVQKAVKEYVIDEEVFREMTTRTISQQVAAGNLDSAIELIKSTGIVISDKDTLGEILVRFHNAYERGDMKTASDIAHYFKLKDSRVEKADFTYWNSLIGADNFAEALKFTKERKIPRKVIEPVIKEMYQNLIHQERTEEAVKLRKDYRIGLNIIEWILISLKKILG